MIVLMVRPGMIILMLRILYYHWHWGERVESLPSLCRQSKEEFCELVLFDCNWAFTRCSCFRMTHRPHEQQQICPTVNCHLIFIVEAIFFSRNISMFHVGVSKHKGGDSRVATSSLVTDSKTSPVPSTSVQTLLAGKIPTHNLQRVLQMALLSPWSHPHYQLWINSP